MAFSILFVCTGNSCRSPMAEGILKAAIPAGLRGEIDVTSAGTAGIEGMPATALSREVAARRGVNLSGHRSRGADRGLVGSADLVLGLARDHVEALRTSAPEARGRIHLLSEFADGTDVDIPDPIGGTVREYEQTFELIERYVRKALPAIIAMAEGRRS